MGVVKDMLDAFHKAGIPANWYNTGGGCMAVVVEFGPLDRYDFGRYVVSITGRDDNFDRADIDGVNDDLMTGFAAYLDVHNSEGESVFDGDGVELYRSGEDLVSLDHAHGYTVGGEDVPSGERVIDLPSELAAMVGTVAWYVIRVANAEHAGRTGSVVWDPIGGWVE